MQNEGKQHGLKFIDPGNKWDPLMASFSADESGHRRRGRRPSACAIPKTIIEKHLELLKKWEGLVDDIAGDADKFAAMLQSEIYSKIDPETW